MVMALGCDTATMITKANLQTLLNGGYTFIGRYLGHLTVEEMELTAGSGICIVCLQCSDERELHLGVKGPGSLLFFAPVYYHGELYLICNILCEG